MTIRGRALCNRNLRTPPGPEGSNGKEALLCAAGSPGPAMQDVETGFQRRSRSVAPLDVLNNVRLVVLPSCGLVGIPC